MTETIPCYGCHGKYAEDPAPGHAHPYIGAIPECWHVYTQLLTRVATHPALNSVKQMANDAYVAQHIGDQADKRVNQSANLHLIGLYLAIEKNYTPEKICSFRALAGAEKSWWPPIEKPKNPQWMTICDIATTTDEKDTCKKILSWGNSVWDAYADAHETIIQAYDAFYKKITMTDLDG